jgi:hypothetical protein
MASRGSLQQFFIESSTNKSSVCIKQENEIKHPEASDRLCGLVVRVPGYRSRGPGSDSQRYQIFWEVVGLERGPLSHVRLIEEILEWKSSSSGEENRINGRGILCADHATPSICKIGTNFANKRRSLGRYTSRAD